MKTLRLLHGTILIKLIYDMMLITFCLENEYCVERDKDVQSQFSNAFSRDVNIDMHRPLASEDTKYLIPFQP